MGRDLAALHAEVDDEEGRANAGGDGDARVSCAGQADVADELLQEARRGDYGSEVDRGEGLGASWCKRAEILETRESRKAREGRPTVERKGDM